MNGVNWEHRPRMAKPVLVVAFGGWNDAGDAATGAIRFLAGKWHARSFATIDPEDYFDFSQSRPIVRIDDAVTREIEWPTNRFTATSKPKTCNVLFLHGTEPQLRWKTFCSTIIEVAQSLGVREIITLGSLLTDVPHTRPSPITVATRDSYMIDHFKMTPAQYEGPTGVVAVLNHMAHEAGMESTSLWASVPHYVAQTPSPKAMLALVKATTDLLSVEIDTDDLEQAADAYESQVTELVSSDEDIANYVAQLELSDDEESIVDVDGIADEAQQFLREQGY